MFPSAPTSVITVAQIIQLAVAPVFLLAGIGAFLNVCAGRLSRIVARARQIEPPHFFARRVMQQQPRFDIAHLQKRQRRKQQRD